MPIFRALTDGKIAASETTWWLVRDDVPDEPFVEWGSEGEAREALTTLRQMHQDHTWQAFEVEVQYAGKRLDW